MNLLFLICSINEYHPVALGLEPFTSEIHHENQFIVVSENISYSYHSGNSSLSSHVYLQKFGF